jgi:hypothetical protein
MAYAVAVAPLVGYENLSPYLADQLGARVAGQPLERRV